MSSSRFILTLAALNVVGMELGRLSPQPPSPVTTLVSLGLLGLLLGAALLAGRRPRAHWLRDAVRDVVAGQTLGWAAGLALVGFLHGGLDSPAWLAAFAPVFVAVCAVVTAAVAPLGRRLLGRPAPST
ncbi:MAG TPA: hypothetical protein VFJ74_15600 [Gemmatimonadaceae bacterium]|nr:hypothetical protein [Gemmatimonadaceae bacterium]